MYIRRKFLFHLLKSVQTAVRISTVNRQFGGDLSLTDNIFQSIKLMCTWFSTGYRDLHTSCPFRPKSVKHEW